MKDKTVVILKGISGSGKTSFCELIAEPKIVCCADTYYERDGGYHWVAADLGKAHAQCRKTFDEALMNPYVDTVVVANTNCKPSDYAYYVDEANKVGARVTYVVIEKRHDSGNIHNVPPESLRRQAENLKQDIKLS